LYQRLLADSRFFDLLLRIDQELAAAARHEGCGCGGALHAANYRRKPRGGAAGLREEHEIRLSFCCAREGCRRRRTPPSVRFLGRKVYYGAVVLLMPILCEGLTPRRVQRLQQRVGVSMRTLRRWRRWWQQMAGTRWFATIRGLFAVPVAGEGLPGSLLEALAAVEPIEQVVGALRLMVPVSTGSAAAAVG